MILLKEITRHNFRDVIKLAVSDEQTHFVASNMFSLAQAKAQPECVPLAAYDDEALVGFVMYCIDVDENEYWFYRLMIDQKHQGKGFGRAAMLAALDIIKSDSSHSRVYIGFEPANTAAKALYESLGFISDDREVGGEIIYRLDY